MSGEALSQQDRDLAVTLAVLQHRNAEAEARDKGDYEAAYCERLVLDAYANLQVKARNARASQHNVGKKATA